MYLFFTRKNQVKTNRKLWYGENLIITGWEMGIGHYQNRSIAPSSRIMHHSKDNPINVHNRHVTFFRNLLYECSIHKSQI